MYFPILILATEVENRLYLNLNFTKKFIRNTNPPCPFSHAFILSFSVILTIVVADSQRHHKTEVTNFTDCHRYRWDKKKEYFGEVTYHKTLAASATARNFKLINLYISVWMFNPAMSFMPKRHRNIKSMYNTIYVSRLFSSHFLLDKC